MLERGYGALSTAQVAAAANVGRSTFYEHFHGLDDVLAESVGPLFSRLAGGCLEERVSHATVSAIEHIWENRRFARVLLSGEHSPVVLRALAAQFTSAIERSIPKPVINSELVGLQLAAGQLAVLYAWMLGRTGYSAREIACVLHAGARGALLALVRLRKNDW